MCRWLLPAPGTWPVFDMSSISGRSDTVPVLEPPLYQYSATSASDGSVCARVSRQPFSRVQKRAGLTVLSLLTTVSSYSAGELRVAALTSVLGLLPFQ